MKKSILNLNESFRKLVLPVAGAFLFSLSISSCDSTKEITENEDPSVEVSDNAVTDPDTTNTTK